MSLNKFKGSNNGWLTMGLFADVMSNQHRDRLEVDSAIYWLEDRKDPNDKRPIFKDAYIKLKDPTGVKAAKLYLDGYSHFEFLMERSPWFKEAIERWNREIDATLKAEALEAVRTLAKEGGSESVQLAANRYIANQEYNKQPSSPKRGRPSKEEVKGEIVRQARSISQTEDDFQRMSRKDAN